MKFVAVILLLFLAGCMGQPDPAEVATYRAIAPEHRAYVSADPALTREQRERRLRTLDRWADALGLPKESR